MSRLTAPSIRARLPRGAASGLAMLLSASATAAPVSLYPPASEFRALQLTTLACGRDNDAASCGKARAIAEPLLDHPRLSSTCKDTLWAIRQKGYPAAANSPERRDGIDRAAKDLTVFCRQPAVPAASGSGVGGSGSGSPFSAPAPR